MRIAVLALALLPATAVAEENDPAPQKLFAQPRRCENAGSELARPPAHPDRPHKLAAEPLANQYLTVLRIQDGCDKPVKVREEVGAEQR
jgi:hypothetical protein